MSNFARIINNVAVDVSIDPENHFHPDIAKEFVSVPEEVKAMWSLVEDVWTAPELIVPTPVEPVVEYGKVSPIEFKLLFTSGERLALKAARSTDPVIDDFYDIIDDPRLNYVDLSLTSTQNALAYFVSKGVLTEQRKAEILANQAQ